MQRNSIPRIYNTQIIAFYYGTHSSSLWLAFHASVQQGKALKMWPHCAQQPDYTVPCLPECTRSPYIKGTRYRGILLYVNSQQCSPQRSFTVCTAKVYGI